MNHPDEDRLLEFVLQTLDEPASSRVRSHVSECQQCRDVQQKLQDQIDRLARVDMQIDLPELPRVPAPQRRFVQAWRWAAVLAVGFLLGFMAARFSENPSPIPVPQRLMPVQAPAPASGYVACRALDLRVAQNQ